MQNTPTSKYPDAVDGDIYLNPLFGDLWIVQGDRFILINDGYSTSIDDPAGFIKVGHTDGVKSVVRSKKRVRIVDT